jgi:DNA processing protein
MAMTDKEAYVAFNLTGKVGAVTLESLVASCGSVSEAWRQYPRKISRLGGEVDWEAEFRKAKSYGVEILTPADEAYPERLRSVRGHPLALYVKGDAARLSDLQIAMVGTRRATAYGLGVANRLSYDLAKAGWAIVSGLALGIDAEAHRGALGAKGVTIGVLGSALDEFFPNENRDLAKEIVASGGCVVSEFPFGRNADKTTFPIRNRTVAALSMGVVAVESPIKSGTLITTSIALEMGRTVMAIPGGVDRRMSAGCLKLIREGARLVRHADDVMEEMAEFGRLLRPPAKPDAGETAGDGGRLPAYSAEEAMVMLHVDEEGVGLDEIARKTGLAPMKVSSIAVMLRIKGFVRFLPGNRISLSTSPK